MEKVFQKQIRNFYIKYEESSPKPFTHRYDTTNVKQKPPLFIQSRRNKSQYRQIATKKLSIDTTELQNRIKRKGHVQSQNNQQFTQKKLQKNPQSVSFRQKTIQKGPSAKNKQYQRIPIQYSEDSNQTSIGKIIYKGYTPRNSDFLMNYCKQMPEDLNDEQGKKNSYETDLQFNSKFQSGNLLQALRISKKQYWLYMREDTNTKGLRQWFFFQTICNRPLKITFRIYKFSKKYSLYRKGMKPYIKQNQSIWAQKGQDVKYLYDDQQGCYYLQFNYQFQKERQRILIATMPPYTYSRLSRFIGNQCCEANMNIRMIGRSLGGVEIPLIEISNKNGQQKNAGSQKKAIIILGRTHPAETCSNYSIEAIVQTLKSNSKIKEVFDFFIVPMTNPDGVIVGNHRTNLIGIDLNRKFDFNFAQKQMYPQVQTIKNLVREVKLTHKIEFLIDLHGHSAKQNIFAYGQQEQLQTQKHLKSRIVPKLLDQKLDSFIYNSCVFQSSKQKKSTARVYFSKRYSINTTTIQQSYGLKGTDTIGINDWRLFGQIFVESLQQYAQKYMDRKQKMQELLIKEIEAEKKQIQNRIEEPVKIKTQRQEISYQTKIQKIQKLQICFKRQKAKKQIIHSQTDQSLSSGDEELQNGEIQVQALRRQIFVKKNQIPKRESYVMSDKTIEIQQLTKSMKEEILHEQKQLPLVARIMKMQSKRKTSNELIDLLTKRSKKKSKDMAQKIKEYSIKLPNLNKYV